MAERSLVPRHEYSSLEQGNALMRNGEPFIMNGQAARWPLFQELERRVTSEEKLRWFASIAPVREVLYSRLPEAKGQFTFGKHLSQDFSFSSLLLRDYVELVVQAQTDSQPQTLYMQAQKIPECGELLLEFSSCISSPGEVPLFWLGNEGQSTALHNDKFQNAIAIMMGRKRVFLFPPCELKNLYIAPLDRRVQGALTSLVEPRSPDFYRFPRFRLAIDNMMTAEVGPGEILYIPPLWWHLVETFGVNLSVNLWTEEVEHSDELYEPDVLRLLSSNIYREPPDARLALSRLFSETIRGGTAHNKSTYSDQVRAAAAREIALLAQIVEPRCRDRWADWIEQMANWIVFQCEGDPFPSLGPAEYEQMVARQRSAQAGVSSCG